MNEIRQILCPVDFSETSEHALEYAVELARRFEAQLTLLHVCQLPSYALSDGYAPPEEFQEDYRNRLQERVDEVVARYSDRGVTIAGGLSEGVPHEAIIDAAGRLQADLIVIGTHGRTGLSHALLGSVAERVVRTSKVPVLTVRRPH